MKKTSDSRPKRVIHLVPSLFGDKGVVGGAERYVLELARHMARQTPTTLVTFGDKGGREQQDGLSIEVIGDPLYVRGQKANPVSLRLVPALLRADVIHCHQQHIVASSLAASIGRVTGRKVFVSDLGGGGWDISGYLSTDGWYHGHLHISEYSREVFGHAGKNWAHVIYGGVDTEKFCPAPDGIRTGNACYVGRILPHKGVDNLVEAMPTDMGLDVVGRPYHSEYYQLLRTLAEGKQIHFKTGADDADLVRTYQRALCVVLPSVYRTVYGDTSRVPELLGQTLLEGMACETPAICTDVASMPEVVEEGVTGFVVPPNDPATLRMRLIWLRDNPGRAREMGQAARQRVLQRFTWPAVVNRCMNIYRA